MKGVIFVSGGLGTVKMAKVLCPLSAVSLLLPGRRIVVMRTGPQSGDVGDDDVGRGESLEDDAGVACPPSVYTASNDQLPIVVLTKLARLPEEGNVAFLPPGLASRCGAGPSWPVSQLRHSLVV